MANEARPNAGDGAAMMAQLLEGCRQAFGAAPRSFSAQERRHFSPPTPMWMWFNRRDELWTLYRERMRVLETGQVVWAALVQANQLLFEPGTLDCPAAAVYGLDPSFDRDPDELRRIAHELFALKGTTPADPALRQAADDITNEMARRYNMRLPDALTGGRDVYMTCIMVHRRHLPTGYLTQGLFPLVVAPGQTPATMILPSRYWGPELRFFWEMRGG